MKEKKQGSTSPKILKFPLLTSTAFAIGSSNLRCGLSWIRESKIIIGGKWNISGVIINESLKQHLSNSLHGRKAGRIISEES